MHSAVPTPKILPSLGNGGFAAAAAMVDVEEAKDMAQDGSGSFATNDMGQHGSKKGWTEAEDKSLVDNMQEHGEEKWSIVLKNSGLTRSGERCTSTWVNLLGRYLSTKKDLSTR